MWFRLFFFFKQKTAYEMRISDWSSDVCSSDLGERIHFQPAIECRTHVRHAVGEGEGQLLHRRRPGLVHMIAADRDAVEARHVLGRIGDDVRDDPHRGLGRIDIGVADHELLEDRSEEHTSELQSLMRISYAVFCLKKKNTN